MLELTMLTIAIALIFYVLQFVLKRTEISVMSLIMSVIALAAILQDSEILEADYAYYVIPAFYVIVTSGIAMIRMGADEK